MTFSPDAMEAACLGHRTRMAARAITRAYNVRLRPLGLQITQFAVLVCISAGGHGSVAAIAERLDLEASGLLRTLRLLERRGLIRADGGRGRNGRQLQLTAEGGALLTQAAPLWAQAQHDLARALPGSADDARKVLGELEAAAASVSRSGGQDR